MPATPATPLQVAQYGHVAARVRALLSERGWKPLQLSQELGAPASSPMVYNWLNAKEGVGPKYRNKLARLCDCPPEDLLGKSANGAAPAPVPSDPPAKVELPAPDDAGYGQALATARTAKGLSQAALGKLVGVSNSHISMLEHGRTTATERVNRHLTAVLNANPKPPKPPRRKAGGRPFGTTAARAAVASDLGATAVVNDLRRVFHEHMRSLGVTTYRVSITFDSNDL